MSKHAPDRRGELNPNWKGGLRFSSGGGYPELYSPTHPHAKRNSCVLVARLIAERALGRRLKTSEIVHHTNEDPLDDRNGNLLICKQDYHMWLHAKMRRS